MVLKRTVLKSKRVQITGYYSFGDIYKAMHNWLELYKKYNIVENKYHLRDKGPGGWNYKIEWGCTKDAGDGYSRYVITIMFTTFGLSSFEMQHAGKKLNLNKGELNMYISAVLETDYKNEWQEKKTKKGKKDRRVMSYLHPFYEKYLYSDRIDEMVKELWSDTWETFNQMKVLLALYKFGDYQGQ